MFRRFRMKTDDGRARIGEVRHDAIHRLDHQMDIDRHRNAVCRPGVRAHRLADHRPDGEVGDVMIVHDVEMDDVGTGADDGTHFLAEAGEISGQNGRGNSVFHGKEFYAIYTAFLWPVHPDRTLLTEPHAPPRDGAPMLRFHA